MASVSHSMVQPEPVLPACPHPVKRPVMLQGWKRLASVHWRYEPEVVQRLIHPSFTVDTFDGAAWVGLIPFWMERIRVPGLPAFGPLSSFPETNVRTYIVDAQGRRGVWFMSLDVTRLLPAVVARVSYHLPYCWSKMSIDEHGSTITYRSSRRWPESGAHSQLTIDVGDPIDPAAVTPLEHFLSARWALGSTWARQPIWANVDHEPWPLQRATVVSVDETMFSAAGLPAPSGEPVALYSPGVDVRIGRPRWMSPRS
ncbi:MAG: YqjF family protein [Ilumatobacteraceae bacterium]